ncbi:MULTISPECIES: hypothetical protein [Oscillatoriales]|nr:MULTISPECIES: hypothetical protein [Oscillatoriales]
MSMSWQEIHREADKLSVLERLELIEAIVQSITDEIRKNPPPPKQQTPELRELLDKKGILYREVNEIAILTPRQLLDTLDEDCETSG